MRQNVFIHRRNSQRIGLSGLRGHALAGDSIIVNHTARTARPRHCRASLTVAVLYEIASAKVRSAFKMCPRFFEVVAGLQLRQSNIQVTLVLCGDHKRDLNLASTGAIVSRRLGIPAPTFGYPRIIIRRLIAEIIPPPDTILFDGDTFHVGIELEVLLVGLKVSVECIALLGFKRQMGFILTVGLELCFVITVFRIRSEPKSSGCRSPLCKVWILRRILIGFRICCRQFYFFIAGRDREGRILDLRITLGQLIKRLSWNFGIRNGLVAILMHKVMRSHAVHRVVFHVQHKAGDVLHAGVVNGGLLVAAACKGAGAGIFHATA